MSQPHILIVEDELIVALELEDRLHRQGYVVVGTARSADEALAVLDRSPVDLAILDLRIVGPLDGVELAALLRERGVPFVFLTAHGDEDTLARVRAVEPLGYLLKPFDERLLRLTIETALQRYAGERARLAAVRAQRAAEATQAAILEHSPDAVLLVGSDGRIELHNRAAERMFALAGSSDEPTIAALLPELDHPRIAELAASREPVRVEGRRRDGSPFPAEVACGLAPIDERERLIVIARDLTRQVQLEDQLARARQLEIAGRVASGVAHDLNNLLSVVWMTSYLLKHAPSEEIPELLADLDSAVNLGASLTARLLSMARPERGEPKAVSVNDALRTIIKLARRACGPGVTIATELDPEAGSVWIDSSQLDQLILNLVINADRAMPEGGRLTLRSRSLHEQENQPGGAPRVLVEVEDTGVGIDESIRAQLFEPFFSTRKASGGTGLGLSIVHDIIERAGGRLEFESERGRGTVFRVSLPRYGEAPDAGAEDRPGGRRVAGRGRPVLVVDDDGTHRRSLARLLAAEGFRPLEARGAGEAILMAERGDERLALAIVDVEMPYMDGHELSERLKRHDRELPILLVSAAARTLSEPPEAADATLAKPLEPDALFDAVAQLLAATGAPRA